MKKLSRAAKRRIARQKRYKKEQIEKYGNDNAKYTAKQLIRQSSKIGISRKEMKSKNVNHFGIHSKATYKKTMGEVGRFCTFVQQEYGINRLNQFKSEHAAAYLEYKEKQGLTKGSLRNVETALIHLSKAMERNQNFGELPSLMTGERKYQSMAAHHEIERKQRSYSMDQVITIIQKLEEKGHFEESAGVTLSLIAGLRAEEVCTIEKRHFIKQGDAYQIVIKRDDLSHVTKGNRYREVSLNPKYTNIVEMLLQGKQENDRLISLDSLSLSSTISYIKHQFGIATNILAMHGVRHLFARMRFREEVNESLEHLSIMERILDNLFEGQRADAGFVEGEKILYEETKAAMDRVHDALGHGQNRFDLAMRYLDLKY